MHAGIADWLFPLKSVVGKAFPAFPAHAQLTILCKHVRERNIEMFQNNGACICFCVGGGRVNE